MSSMTPKLTVVLPHLDRTEKLAKAIGDLLHQKDPCNVLVADQGHTEATRELMVGYADNELVTHAMTSASCLWENWKVGAELAMVGGAEYVSWCQDDDCVSYHYSSRINLAFDTFHDADFWTGRLNCAESEDNAIWFAGNGPMLPMNVRKNIPRVIPGHLMVPIAYFNSWALSPAVAFRVGRNFREALEEVPTHCDLYTERTILASMGLKSPVVCDPVVVGYWIHHGGNESYRQNATTQPAQEKTFLAWMDETMDRTEKWEEILLDWSRSMPNTHLQAYIHGMEKLESRYVAGVAQILQLGMKHETTYESIRRVNDPTYVAPMEI